MKFDTASTLSAAHQSSVRRKGTTIQRRFAKRAKSFVQQRSPAATVMMPGCHGIFLNETAAQDFGYLSPVARTESAALKYFTKKQLAQIKAFFPKAACFCYPKAIVALKTRHCVLERAYAEMRRTRKKHFIDVAAILISQNHKRIYQLYRVEIHLVSAKIIEVRMLRLTGMTITVRTLEQRANGAASILGACSEWSGSRFATKEKKQNIKAGKSQYKVYAGMSEAIKILNKGLGSPAGHHRKMLRSARSKVLDAIKDIPRDEFFAVRGFLNGIFGTNLDYSPSAKPLPSVINELGQIQERLFDAFVVVDVVASEICKKIKRWRMVRL